MLKFSFQQFLFITDPKMFQKIYLGMITDIYFLKISLSEMLTHHES